MAAPMTGRAALMDLVLPLRCPGCRGVVHRSRRVPPALCVDCADALASLTLGGLGLVELLPGVPAVAAFAYDDVVAAAVRTVKRPGRHGAAAGLGRLLWQVVGPPLADRGVDVRLSTRTWVPATPGARRLRGVEIPRLLAGAGAVPLLRCDRDRPDQTALDAPGRRVNTIGAFRAAGPVPGEVVLVDDVRTTGATLTAAATALQAAGARRVLAVTFAAAGDDARGMAGGEPGAWDRSQPMDDGE